MASAALASLGIGMNPGRTGAAGDLLADQVKDESEEARKKRLAQQAQARLLGSRASPALAALGIGLGYGALG